jgi:drug/metabolite transporter (DMT)-like permease
MTPTPSSPPPTWAVVLAFALIYISWGTTYKPIQWGVRDEHLPPALFGGTRVALAGLILLSFQALRGQSLRLARGELLGVIAVSWMLFVGGNGLINLAEKWVDSGVAAVLVATTPLWLGLFAMFWPHEERLTLRGWTGLIVGIGGIVILLAPKLNDPTAFIQDLTPLLVLGSAGFWALGSLLLRHLRTRTDHLTRAAYQMIIGGSSLTLLGLSLGERFPEHFTPKAIGAFFYLLIVGSLIGFIAFNWLLGHVSATKVGTYAYVNPVIAVLIGRLTGEALTPWILAGITTILLGVFLVRTGERPPTPEPDPPPISASL